MMRSRSIVVLVVGIGVMLGMLAGCGGPSVSQGNYDKIANGMTQAQVEKILGKGQDQAGAGIARLSGKVVVWKDGDKSITVTFVNDKVTAKAQSGL
jgi:hypothetical protein